MVSNDNHTHDGSDHVVLNIQNSSDSLHVSNPKSVRTKNPNPKGRSACPNDKPCPDECVSEFPRCCVCFIIAVYFVGVAIYAVISFNHGYPSLAVSGFSVISDEIAVQAILTNPNKAKIIYDSNFTTSVFYDGGLVAECCSLNPFVQGVENITMLETKMKVDKRVSANWIAKENEVMNFDIKIVSNMTMVGEDWKGSIMFLCNTIGVRFDDNMVGNMVFPLQHCSRYLAMVFVDEPNYYHSSYFYLHKNRYYPLSR